MFDDDVDGNYNSTESEIMATIHTYSTLFNGQRRLAANGDIDPNWMLTRSIQAGTNNTETRTNETAKTIRMSQRNGSNMNDALCGLVISHVSLAWKFENNARFATSRQEMPTAHGEIGAKS